jgi:hypothetical protein
LRQLIAPRYLSGLEKQEGLWRLYFVREEPTRGFVTIELEGASVRRVFDRLD